MILLSYIAPDNKDMYNIKPDPCYKIYLMIFIINHIFLQMEH